MARKKYIFVIVIALVLAVFIGGLILARFSKNNQETVAGDQAESGLSQVLSAAEEGIVEKIESVKEAISPKKENKGRTYFQHKNVTATIFWVGEGASDDNDEISNSSSAWDDQWKKNFGGRDNPKKRDGFYPADFIPKENPFYFALPYNDFGKDGERKADAGTIVPWAKGKNYAKNESMCKNRWVKISKGAKAAYAQWEDVGPFKENDESYVFGQSSPQSKTNDNAGIDVSPAVRDYLALEDIDKVDWQFIEEEDVPGGPWKKIITRSQINWK